MKRINLPAILKNKNLCLLLATQLSSSIAATTVLFSLINIVFSEVSSSSFVALITFLYYLPGTFLGIFAGAVVDKVDKRKIFILSNLSQAIVVLFFLAIKEQIFLVFPLILLYALFDEFLGPAMAAVLPNVVNKKELGVVNTIWFFISHGSIAAGALISGVVLSLVRDYQLIFPLISLILLIGIAMIYFVPKKVLNHTKVQKEPWKIFNPEVFLADIRDGLMFLKTNKLVLFPILFLAFTQAFVGISISIAPGLARVLEIPIASTSLVIFAPGIVGAIVGGIWVSQIIKREQFRKKTLIINGLLLSGISLALIYLTSFSPLARYLVWILVIALGLFAVSIIIPTKTLIQEHSPFEVRGRVYGVLNMLISLAGIVPLLVVASLVDLFGVRTVILLSGLFLISMSVAFSKKQALVFKQIINQK